MKKRVGIVADDITGANDVGIMFAKNGYKTGIFPYHSNLELQNEKELDVIIIDTNSRFDSPETAGDKVYYATKMLIKASCQMYYNKTCSVFRGNIGAEFDAMQKALRINNSMVIAAFPKNGRTTLDGIHYVYGTKLEESQFRNDPIHKMTESSLANIIGKQTNKKIGIINYSYIDQSKENLRKILSDYKKIYNYIIFDARNQEDLKKIAELVSNEINICGSSAIGEEIASLWNSSSPLKECNHRQKTKDSCGTLMLVGSLQPQSNSQVEYLLKKGYSAFELNTMLLFEKELLLDALSKISREVISKISQGEDVMIYTSRNSFDIEKTKKLGYKLGYDDKQLGKMVSGYLAELVKQVKDETHFKKLVVAGGDTSAAISESLGINKMVIVDEIEAGLPNMYGYSKDNQYLMVLKSGSFGSEIFLEKACQSLKTI